VKCAHSRYKTFVDFGDAETYRKNFEEIRRSYQDIASPEAVTAKAEPDSNRGS
jgi:hypothetical protein